MAEGLQVREKKKERDPEGGKTRSGAVPFSLVARRPPCLSKTPAALPRGAQSSSWLGRGQSCALLSVSLVCGCFLDIDDYFLLFPILLSSRIHLSTSRRKNTRTSRDFYLPPPSPRYKKMQKSTVFISFVMVAACCLLADAAPQDLGSPIRIAQCRALCLDKVNKHLYKQLRNVAPRFW